MKYIIFLCFFFLISISAKSQEFKAGVVAGVVASQVDGDQMAGYFKAGFSGGLFVYRDFNKASRFQGELLYTMKGSRTSPKNTNPDMLQVSASYIDISLIYIYKLFPMLNFRIGLTPNVLLDAREHTPTGLEQNPNEAPAFRRIGVIGLIGASYYFSDKFSITWSYNYSLYSIRSGEAEIYDTWSLKQQNDQRHNYMSFMLGYRF
ncbi:MAG: outer membrane beta-barrel protein [Bacteroidales bacterium]|jgi:hypothetical protein|nr:outer membrane beta-barrel protein [Bacteroidales bacterium]